MRLLLGAVLGFYALWPALPNLARADNASCEAAHEQAQALRRQGALIASREQLLRCAQNACPRKLSADCSAWLAEVERGLPSVVFAVTDASGRDLADVRVHAAERVLTERTDGHALALDPGAYSLRFEASGYEPAELTVAVREAEKNRILRVQLIAAAPPAQPVLEAPTPQPAVAGGNKSEGTPGYLVASYVLGGTALVALATGVTFGLLGNHTYSELEKRCSPSCSDAELAGGRREYIAADIGFAVAAGTAIAAAVVFFTGRSGAESPPLSAAVGRDGVVLSYRTRL